MPIPSTPSIMPNVLGYAADTVQIPETTPTGQGIPSFRDLFPFITQVDPDAGGVMVERAWMNALFNLLGQHAFFQQSGCVYPWQATLNYIAGSHVKGSDDVEYIALQPSGPDVSGTGAKDPVLEANRNYWISLSSFVSGDFVPDSRRVIAGTGLTGGGPLSADVTLAAKLTDSVSLADSTTAASAKAVKTAYDLANSKQANLGFTPVQQGGGAGQEGQKIYIGWSPSGLKAQADVLDLGNVVTTSAGCTKAPSAANADRANTANGIGGHSWLDVIDTGGNPQWVVGLATDGSDKIRPFDPASLRVDYANSAGSAATANTATGLTYTFTTNSFLVLPSGGTWFVLKWWDGDSGSAMGNWSGGQIVAGGSRVDVSNGAFALRVA